MLNALKDTTPMQTIELLNHEAVYLLLQVFNSLFTDHECTCH